MIPVELPRYHHFELTPAQGLRLRGFPRSRQRVRVGFVFLRGRGQASPLHELRRVIVDLLEPLSLQLGSAGRARILATAQIPYPRVVRVGSLNTPYRVREGGSWLWRGGQRARDGGEWLLVYHQDTQPVDVVAGSAMLEGIRPGPGSLYSMALSDIGEELTTVTARLLQTGPFLKAPSVVMSRPFDEVTLDGKPWRYVLGQRVFLPRARGVYRIEVYGAGKDAKVKQMPALARTGAHVQSCRYDPQNRVLEVFTVPAEDGAGGREHTGWFTGGVPVRVEGGELVPRQEFTYRREADAQAAEAAGVIVRFKPGLLRLYYEDPNQ